MNKFGENGSDVIVVGGGLAGPLMALALASAGLRVSVIDAQPRTRRASPDFDGRAYALSLSSVRLLEALGLWERVSMSAEAITDIKVSDGRPGEGASPLHVHFDHRETDDGPMGHMLEDRFLRAALLDAMAASDLIEERNDARVTAWQSGAVVVADPDGMATTLSAPLVIGADGRGSAIARLAGIRRQGWDYRQTSLVAAVAHERPHDGCAHQFFTPSGPLAILPLPGNRSSIVWTETRARAERIAGLDDPGFLDALRPVFGDFLGEISLEGRRFSYPLGLSLAQAFTGPRVALIGDAAHGIHPLAGQGFNLGVRDVAALAETVVDARRRGEDIGAENVLDRYARWRRFDTSLMVAATDVVNRVFSNDNPILRAGRDLALGALGQTPALRRSFMRQAAGVTGDLPRLMAGQRL